MNQECVDFAVGVGNYKPERIAFMVGPEGGFERDGIERAQQLAALPVTMGSCFLRRETAAIVAAALAQLLVGDYV